MLDKGTAYDERSAGGIVYKKTSQGLLWLVVKAFSYQRGGDHTRGRGKTVFKFPKGHLRLRENLKPAAIREVEEEGGIKAKIIDKLGSRNYYFTDRLTNRKIVKRVTFFLMEYVSDSNLKYADREIILERLWLPYEEALKTVAYDSERQLLKKAKERVERTG